MCLRRVLPYWNDTIAPSVREGRTVLVSAHNNVIRCLVHHIDGVTEDALSNLEIPTGAPLVYSLDEQTMRPIGTADALGFRGKFLEVSKDELEAARYNHYAQEVGCAFITPRQLLMEKRRLGIIKDSDDEYYDETWGT